MKSANPFQASFRAIALLDLVFALSVANTTPTAYGMKAGYAAVFVFGCYVLRVALYYATLSRYVGPSAELASRIAQGGAINEAELRDADRLLQRAPQAAATATAVGFGLSFPAVYVAYVTFIGPVGLPAFHVQMLLASMIASVFGAVAIVVPLLSWALSRQAGANHREATRRGWLLGRPAHSIAGRLVLMAVCLSATPAAQVMGINLQAEAENRSIATGHEASELGARLALSVNGQAADPLAAIRGVEAERTTLFIVDPQGQVAERGRALPSWATAEFLARSVESAPERNTSVARYRLDDGRVVGAVVVLPGLDAAFFKRVGNELVSVVLLGIVAAWLLSRSVSGPLEQTAELVRRVARQGDLSQVNELLVAKNDEIGSVMVGLNELVLAMREMAGAASAIGAGQLTIEVDGQGELPDAFRGMLGQLRTLVVEMRDTSSELASAATEIFAASQEQEAASTSHSTGMREIAQTMESLSDSAAHVASAVQGVLGNAERTLQNTERMDSRIEQLTGHANRIGDILEVIRDIADRTDLLALNGSLEASRAGEAGVGFSLVASEMRRLAERVTASIGDIKSLVSDIRESGASTVVATEESKALADATTQAARGIALVTQQQQSSTEQVSQHVRSVAEVVQQAAAATTQTRASADSLKRHAERLTQAVSRFRLSA